MSGPLPGPDWLYFAAAIALGAIGLPLLFWSLWWDRSRGKRRCGRCWYDMTGVPGLTCPECGRAAKNERGLQRSRRRWWFATPGVFVLILAGASAVVPALRRNGPWPFLPVTVILGLEGAVGPGTWPSLTAHRRQLPWRDASDWQLRTMVLRHLRDNHRFREVWPAGASLFAFHREIEPPDGRNEVWSIDFAKSLHGRVGNRIAPESYETLSWHLFRELDDSAQDRAITITLRGRTASLTKRRLQFEIPIRRVPTIDDAITPVRDPAIDAEIRSTLAPRLMLDPHTRRARLSFTQPTSRGRPRIAVGLTITIERDGAAIASTRILTRTSQSPGDIMLPTEVIGDIDAIIAADANDPAWTVRIKGDGEMALRDFAATHYWAGEFVLPLSEVMK